MSSENGKSRLSAREVFDIGKLEISGHARQRFHLRARVTDPYSSEQIRQRVGDALQIEDPGQSRDSFYRDNLTDNLVFLVRRNRHGRYALITTLDRFREGKKI